MSHDPRLDAYRAVCITLVFLLHWSLLGCGWIGVQAFFVLSGYLITGILRRERQGASTRDYFVNFYARRALRIFPVYFAYLALLVVMAKVIRPGVLQGLDEILTPSLPYLLSYTENFHRIATGFSSPFYSHLWSLSIEEQFYLVWPLVVLFLPGKRLLWLSCGAILAALLIRWGGFLLQVQTGFADKTTAGEGIYFFTGSHMDAFAFGALLTFRGESARMEQFIRLASRWVPVGFVLSGLWMLALGWLAHYGMSNSSLGWPLYLDRFYAYVWGYTLIDALFFIALANIGRFKVLADAPLLQRLGRVSYGFYIFHCPIIRLSKYFLNDPYFQFGLYDSLCLVVTFALTWALAELSFRFLEQPLLRLKGRFATSGGRGAGLGVVAGHG